MNLFCFPCNFIISERICWRNTFTIHNHKLFAEIYANVNFIESVFPFFVDFVFESKLNVAAADLTSVDEK